MTDLDDRQLRLLEDRIEDLKIKDKGLEQRKVMDGVFDRSTLMVFYKLISDGHLDTLDYVVSSGKEAKVFHGTSPDGERRAVKVFLVTNAVFRNILPYIDGDPRFEGIERDRRAIIMEWAKKEFGNLEAYGRAGVRVPEPVTVKDNVLVTEFLGDEEGPAPLLKEIQLEDPGAWFEEIAGMVETGIDEAGLVHADLSQYNLLVWDGKPWLIDCGQAVPVEHPSALEFLTRDAENLCAWFEKQGVDVDPDELTRRWREAAS